MSVQETNARTQRLCLWCGPLFALLFFLGFGVVARFIPPGNPAASATSLAHMYRLHAGRIRIGMLLSLFALAFWVPWVAVISVQLRRIEGRHSPLAYAQLGLGAVLPVAFFPALYSFAAAAFRPDRSPQTLVTLNDLGWLPFTGIIYTIVVQNLVIGAAVLSDRGEAPVYPRWFAWFNFVMAALYCPACLDIFSTKGSFAWNGLWSWWLSLVSFFVWEVTTTALTFRAVRNQEAAEGATVRRTPVPAR